MSSKSSRKPQMILKETYCKTKRFFHRTLMNLKTFFAKGYQKLPKTPTSNPISCRNKINFKLQELDNFYQGFCEHWDSMEKVKKGHISSEVLKGDEQCSSIAECSSSDDLKEENKAIRCIGRKQEKPTYLDAGVLAQKMKELEMMDAKDMDHVLDVEEVLHYYSRLTCPAYLEIVDKFFMDMYSELNVTEQSKSANSSIRKLGSSTVHGSARTLRPQNL